MTPAVPAVAREVAPAAGPALTVVQGGAESAPSAASVDPTVSPKPAKPMMALTAANLDLEMFTAQHRPELKGILIDRKVTVATNSNIMAVIPRPAADPEAVPDAIQATSKPVLITTDLAQSALKNLDRKAIKSMGAHWRQMFLAVAKKVATVNVQQVPGTLKVQGDVIDEEYPDYRVALPRRKPEYQIHLNATLLRKMAAWIEKHGDKSGMIVVNLHGKSAPVEFNCEVPGNGTARFLVMPMRP